MSRRRQNARFAKAMLGEKGQVARVAALADLYESASREHVWIVSSLAADGDGAIYEVTFEGPFAYERAAEYAAAKYAGFLQHERCL